MTETAAKRDNRSAAYLRLSAEDRDRTESISISGQRELTREYMESHGLRFVKEYVDDGWSGTDFNRPAFQELITDCKAGVINCIVVKDLSRLGRNYIETGRYLERIFPLMGIRVIAITDHYDSFQSSRDEDDLIIPVKNLINDSYCRDISAKVRSQQDLKRRNGEFIGSFAGFGYIKDPENKNHLIVDEPAANTVRLIFQLKISGKNPQAIADYLNEIGAETPYQRKLSLGFNYHNVFCSDTTGRWISPMVQAVLQNELYTGTVVQGKNRKVNYKVKKLLEVDKDDWIRVEGMHEPIISRETFDQVQSLLAMNTCTPPGRETVHLLSGFVRCGDCGANMVRKKMRQYCNYRCSAYIRSHGCTSHNIPEWMLVSAVTEAVRQRIAVLLEVEELLKNAKRLPGKQHTAATLDTQIQTLLDEITRIRNRRTRLYQDQAEGLVDREEYMELDAQFAERQKAAEDTIEALQKKRERLMNERTDLAPWLESIKKNGNIQELSREMLVCLVDHIDVFQEHRVEVHFRYEEETDELLAMARGGEERIK